MLNIFYFGRRGGGSILTYELVYNWTNSSQKNQLRLFINSQNESIDLFREIKNIELVEMDLDLRKYLSLPFKAISSLIELRHKLAKGDLILVTMTSPFDSLFNVYLSNRYRLIRIVHDLTPHPGDWWPRTSTIRSQLKRAHMIISLSTAVANEISSLGYEYKLIKWKLPPMKVDRKTSRLFDEPYYLVIGRLRSYKNIELAIQAWHFSEITTHSLIIAGSASNLPNYSANNFSNIIIMEEWLSDEKFGNLIENAEAVVFPYIEASQSGVLATAIVNNKKIILTPVKNLLMQISDWSYENVFVASDFSVIEFSKAIMNSLHEDRNSNMKYLYGELENSLLNTLKEIR